MPEENQSNSFLPEDTLNPDKLSIEIPAEPTLTPGDRIPSGYDPMGEVELRGHVSRNLASGRVPWWVLITGWLLFGGLAFVLLHLAIQSFSWVWLLPGAIAVLFLLILWRGTWAKLSSRRRD